MRPLLIVGAGTFSHLIIGRWIPSPWLVPDLTLLSVLLVMMKSPGHPIGPALFGGALVMLLTVQHPVLIGLTYVGAGGLVKWLAGQWEVGKASIQRMIVGIAEGLLLMLCLLLSAPVRGGLMVLAVLRLGVTVLCLPLVRLVVVRLLSLTPSPDPASS